MNYTFRFRYKTFRGIKRINKDELRIGRIYDDGSFAEYIRLYHDQHNIFQMEFLKGSNLAYRFLPECTELLEILEMHDGIIGVTMDMLADELISRGMIEYKCRRIR